MKPTLYGNEVSIPDVQIDIPTVSPNAERLAAARISVESGFQRKSRVDKWRRSVVSNFKRPWKRRQQLPSWDSVRTVELHEEEHLLHAEQQSQDFCERWLWTMQGWLLPMAVGFLCFLTYVVIERGIGALSSIRYGFCTAKAWKPEEWCPEGYWIAWGDGILGFLASTCFGTAMAVLAAVLVTRCAPAASGSGIPEVKTILNGFVLPEVTTARTLLIKVPGLILAVASGLAVGHEGPMVHVSVCWAQMLARLSPQYQHEGKRRELYSAAVAAGVSAAFGTPVGGVLFSLEEVSSHFPSRTLLRAFIASVVATLALSVSKLTGPLTLFSVRYTVTCHPSEYVIFALLGIVGGLVGALFNAINIRWNAFRAKPYFKERVRPVVEVAVVAFLSLVTSWPLALTRPLSPEGIHAMFDTCSQNANETTRNRLQAKVGLCGPDGSYNEADGPLLGMLGAAACVRFLQMAFAIGPAVPAGIFVPSLFIGACLGRFTGGAVKALNKNWQFLSHQIDPGVYSMVGAASVLGGVCRMTISLVVIMLELTGGLDYVVPFMLCVLLAKAVGDAVNESIYDLQIVLKGYPFLHEELDVTFTERCVDIMETGLTKVDISLKPRLSDMQEMLSAFTYRGFPIVDGPHFLGYVRRSKLTDLLVSLEKAGYCDADEVPLDELMPVADVTVMRMVPDAPLSQAHQVFKQLGCQHIFVVGGKSGTEINDALLGILTKKSFLRFLKDGRVGHMPQGPSTELGIPGPSDVAPRVISGELASAMEVAHSVYNAEDVFTDGAHSPEQSDRSETTADSAEEVSPNRPPKRRYLRGHQGLRGSTKYRHPATAKVQAAIAPPAKQAESPGGPTRSGQATASNGYGSSQHKESDPTSSNDLGEDVFRDS
eukprot:CAMPEP_0206421536 /NCGR_PEP_ID=MMETSP0324_2-20121206/1504_1 /ASSEMBLY_ACC=CAM_ASM_000836 /TAXON_ID=2866 /ORGANISM="Crypthecodinium cohnii, Strain Seligo" /LENGTH=881 /DNA_ID=CAMNT_0053885645 /DNA_START=46 /DNA_END=2691 /DNA_ORIENTATION=+